MLAVARRIAFALVGALLFAGGFGAMAWAEAGTSGDGGGRTDEEGTQKTDDHESDPARTTTVANPNRRHQKPPKPAHPASPTVAAAQTSAPAPQTTQGQTPIGRPPKSGRRTFASTKAARRLPARRVRVVHASHRVQARHSSPAKRTHPLARRDRPTRRAAKHADHSTARASASSVTPITPGDRPRDRAVSLLPPPLAGWIGVVGALVVAFVAGVLGAGVWAKRRVLKL